MDSWSPFRHARYASELLVRLAELERQVDEASEDDKLQMVASGGIKRFNADAQHTVQCALAHALTGLALRHSREEVS